MYLEGCYKFCASGEVFDIAESIVGGIEQFRIFIFVDMLFLVCRHWRRGDSMSCKKHCKHS